MSELKSWGVVWTEAIPYSARWECKNPECYWRPTLGMRLYDHMVGFAHEPIVKRDQSIAGKMIVECPRCFEKFWFHVHDMNVEDMMVSKNWPRKDTAPCQS